MEELKSKHRKEQRDLQSRLTQKKKNATKKTRKGVNDECEALQRDLDERQKDEVKALDGSGLAEATASLGLNGDAPSTPTVGDASADLPVKDHVNGSIAKDAPEPNVGPVQKKLNRQKARLARRAAEQEAQAAEAEQEAANLPNRREQEMKEMQSQIKKRNLQEIEIEPDGHCLYSAVGKTLPAEVLPGWASRDVPYQFVRNSAGSFIEKNPDDFAPFLEEPLDEYVRKIKHTAEWGGELELQAIAKSFDIEIRVLQADGRVETMGTSKAPEHSPLWLAYYRHSFGLGEHYNALRPVD